MHTVFRVKRRLEEKQLSGLKVAKRQRLDGDEPVLLTFAGTTESCDSKTVLSVIKTHQAQKSVDSKENKEPETVIGSNDANPPNAAKDVADKNVSSSLLSEADIDDLFKIYDAHQNSIGQAGKAAVLPKNERKREDQQQQNEDSKFVYDIYYVRKDPSAGDEPMCIDFNEENYMLERSCHEEQELVNERDDADEFAGECYEDEDSNAEDNPNNDYPDEDEWYYGDDRGYALDELDFDGYGVSHPLHRLEQEMGHLNFHEDSD